MIGLCVRLEKLQARNGGRQHHQLAGALALERNCWANPQAGDGLAVVVQRLLRMRRACQKEAGIEAACFAHGRDPVRCVKNGVGHQPQTLALAQLDEIEVAVVNKVSRRRKAIDDIGLIETNLVTGVRRASQQHARFLEAFANGSDPVRKTALLDLQQFAGLQIAEVVAHRLHGWTMVDIVEAAPRKHVHSASERSLQRAPQHEDFDAILFGGVANQHHRGCWANWHQRVVDHVAHLSSSPRISVTSVTSVTSVIRPP